MATKTTNYIIREVCGNVKTTPREFGATGRRDKPDYSYVNFFHAERKTYGFCGKAAEAARFVGKAAVVAAAEALVSAIRAAGYEPREMEIIPARGGAAIAWRKPVPPYRAVSVASLTERLTAIVERNRANNAPPPAGPIALHAWPKRVSENFCGVGPVVWGESADSWFDVYVGPTEGDNYHRVNRMLRTACETAGLEFVSMS